MATFPLPRISPTQIRAYQRCPLAYRYRFIDGLEAPPSPSSLLGHALHAAIEANYRSKRRTRSDLALSELHDTFDRVWEEGLPAEGDDARAPRAEFESTREEGYKILEFYRAQVAPSIRPHLIEHRFNLKLPGVPVPVAGQVDLIDQEGTVIDHKSSAHPYPQDYLDTDVQLFCYSAGYGVFRLGVKLKAGELPPAAMLPPARMDIVIRGPEPALQRLNKRYNRPDLERLLGIVHDVAGAIGKGEYRPFWQIEERENPWRTCSGCEYFGICDQRLESEHPEA